MHTRSYPTRPGTPTPRAVPPFALHLLHGWWIASCPECGYELGRSRDQEAAERAGQRRRCPICQPTQQQQGGGLVACCDVLYYDPTQVRRDPGGRPDGLASDGWRPCTAPGQVWTDPDLVLRWICPRHRRQLTALHAAGLADQVRWQRPGLPTGPAPSSEEQAQ